MADNLPSRQAECDSKMLFYSVSFINTQLHLQTDNPRYEGFAALTWYTARNQTSKREEGQPA